eukprot:jgi/Botrbrau1/1174/Bobra.0162s0059.2
MGSILDITSLNGSSTSITVALRKLRSRKQISVREIPELQAVAKKIWTVLQYDGLDGEDFNLIGELLRLIPEEATGSLVDEAFKDGSLYISALQEFFDTLASLPGKPSAEHGQFIRQMFRILLDKIQDLSREWKAQGPEGKCKGRHVCGRAFLHRLLCQAITGARQRDLVTARECLVTAAPLLHNADENVKLMHELPELQESWTSLVVDCLPQCGDGPLQEGILELLYRAGRKGAPLPDSPHLNEEFQGAFQALLKRANHETVIWQEVRPLMLSVNRSLGEHATVYSFPTKQVIFGTSASHVPPGTWIDLGEDHLSVRVILDEETLLDAEPVDIPYEHLRRVRVSSESPSDRNSMDQRLHLHAHLAELPDVIAPYLMRDTETAMVFSFCVTRGAMQTLPSSLGCKVPFIKMIQQQLSNPSPEEIEATCPEISQRPDRVSMLTFEKAPLPLPPAQKAPLQLDKVDGKNEGCQGRHADMNPIIAEASITQSEPLCGQRVTASELLSEGAAPICSQGRKAGSDLFVMEQSVSPEPGVGGVHQEPIPISLPEPDPQPEAVMTVEEYSEGQSQLTSIPKTAPIGWADEEERPEPRAVTIPPNAAARSKQSEQRAASKPEQETKLKTHSRCKDRPPRPSKSRNGTDGPSATAKAKGGQPDWLLNAKAPDPEERQKDIYECLTDSEEEDSAQSSFEYKQKGRRKGARKNPKQRARGKVQKPRKKPAVREPAVNGRQTRAKAKAGGPKATHASPVAAPGTDKLVDTTKNGRFTDLEASPGKVHLLGTGTVSSPYALPQPLEQKQRKRAPAPATAGPTEVEPGKFGKGKAQSRATKPAQSYKTASHHFPVSSRNAPPNPKDKSNTAKAALKERIGDDSDPVLMEEPQPRADQREEGAPTKACRDQQEVAWQHDGGRLSDLCCPSPQAKSHRSPSPQRRFVRSKAPSPEIPPKSSPQQRPVRSMAPNPEIPPKRPGYVSHGAPGGSKEAAAREPYSGQRKEAHTGRDLRASTRGVREENLRARPNSHASHAEERCGVGEIAKGDARAGQAVHPVHQKRGPENHDSKAVRDHQIKAKRSKHSMGKAIGCAIQAIGEEIGRASDRAAGEQSGDEEDLNMSPLASRQDEANRKSTRSPSPLRAGQGQIKSRAAEEWEALDREELLVEASSPDCGFAGMLKKLEAGLGSGSPGKPTERLPRATASCQRTVRMPPSCNDLGQSSTGESSEDLQTNGEWNRFLPQAKRHRKTPVTPEMQLPLPIPLSKTKEPSTMREKIASMIQFGQKSSIAPTERGKAAATRTQAGKAERKRLTKKAEPQALESDDDKDADLLKPLFAKLARLSQDVDSDEDEAGMGELHLMIERVMKSKHNATRKKQVDIIQGLEAHLANRVKFLEDSCQKECKATASYVQQGFDKLNGALQKVVDAMKQTEAEFKARMAEHWARYQQTSDKLGTFEQEMGVLVKKKHASQKRKMEEMEQEAAALIADARAKIARTTSKESKLTSIANLLRPLIS